MIEATQYEIDSLLLTLYLGPQKFRTVLHLIKEKLNDQACSDISIEELEEYAITLEKKSEAELALIVDEVNRNKADKRDIEYDELPEADCDHYVKRRTWTPQEAIALIFGKEPTKFPHGRILTMCKLSSPSQFEIDYQKLWELIDREPNFSDTHSAPQKYIDWAIYNKFEVNTSLLKAIQDRNLHIAAMEDAQNPLGGKEVELRATQLTDDVHLTQPSRTEIRNAKLKEEEAKILKENPSLNRTEVSQEIFERFKQKNLSLLESNRGGLIDLKTIYRILQS